MKLQDQVGLIVDAEGQPTRSALTFPSLPAAIAATGLFVVAAAQEVQLQHPSADRLRELTMCLQVGFKVCMLQQVFLARTQGLSVYQWGNAACVQRLGYGSAGFPAPGEQLFTADGPSGGNVALSGHRKVRHGLTQRTAHHWAMQFVLL